MKNLTPLLTGLVSLVLTVNCSYGQTATDKSRMVARDDEMEWDKIKQNGDFYSYPVMLNGQILDYVDFTMKSRGQLSLVMGSPGSASATTVPFYICLRRDGKTVKEGNLNFLNPQVYSIEISEVLLFSKAGDQLIIIPATNSGGKAKLVLKTGC